jgi:hypothetical protein
VLRSAPPAWSTRVALYGAWGSGKTSVLNLLEDLESQAGVIVVRFSAWSASGEAGIMSLFYSSLADRLKRERIDAPWLGRVRNTVGGRKWLKQLISKAPGSAAESLGAPRGTADILSTAVDLAMQWASISKDDVNALVSQLNGRRVVVFIDDLDRTDPTAIPKTLLALRELLDWPSFAFVLAFDKRIVGQALAQYSRAYGDNASAFLEKIVDFPFSMPIPTPDQQLRLARSAFTTCCPFVPRSVLEDVATVLPQEPRRVKLIARSLGALSDVARRHADGEIDWAGMTLHSLLEEMSPECARAVADLCADTKSELAALLLDWKREEREAKIGAELSARFLSELPEQERARALKVALRLERHWHYIGDDRIRYQLSLKVNDPPITVGEFAAFQSRLAQRRASAVVEEQLARMMEFGASREAAFRDLLRMSIDAYSARLSEMAQSPTGHQWSAARDQADAALRTLEFFWGECSLPHINDVKRESEFSNSMAAVARTWISWTRNDGEQDLRSREQALCLAAAEACNDPLAVFEATSPFFASPAFDRNSAQLIRQFDGKLRAIAAPRIVAELVQRVRRPDGLGDIAGGEPQILTWFIEAQDSPLYSVAEHAEQFAASFSGDLTAATAVNAVQRNAITYLDVILFRTRNGSWGGTEERIKMLAERAPRIVEQAWLAAVKRAVPFRMAGEFRERRSLLIKFGFPQDRLPIPTWLQARLDELDARAKSDEAETAAEGGGSATSATDES